MNDGVVFTIPFENNNVVLTITQNINMNIKQEKYD